MTAWDFLHEHWFAAGFFASFAVFWLGLAAIDVSANIAIGMQRRRADASKEKGS